MQIGQILNGCRSGGRVADVLPPVLAWCPASWLPVAGVEGDWYESVVLPLCGVVELKAFRLTGAVPYYVHTRACNKIKVWSCKERFPSVILWCTACFENQSLRCTGAKSLQKSVSLIWRVKGKAVLLHPLSREKRRWALKCWTRIKVLNLRWKNFFWNFPWKVLVVQKKSLPLHPISERKPWRRVLWKI